MNERLLPFDICANNHGGNVESVAANLHIHPYKPKQREIVYAYILKLGERGASANEVESGLNIPIRSAAARCSELRAEGRVVKYGTRPTATGCNAAVLIAYPVYQAILAEREAND